MNEQQYVDAITKKIRCSGKRKKEIEKQLLTDIQMRVKQGEQLEEIISQMGTAAEIADGFNENISIKEQKQYARNKVLKILIPIVVILILLGTLVYWIFPKTADIAQSRYFNKEQVEAAMKETIELLDAGDYKALQDSAVSKMKPYLTEKTVDEIRRTLSDDWGERKQFGAVYMVELIQANKHFAVGEMTVTYDNISVTYRLTYDADMRFAGVYVR